jgi:ABC-type Fe3+ transport system permease subunit
MKKNLIEILIKGKRFQREFKKQIKTLIIVTLGFTIAFTWRQTIFDLSLAIVKFFTNIKNSSTLSILTSLFITILSIFIIYLTSHYLKNGYDY